MRKRAVGYVLMTVLALVLLFSFRTPATNPASLGSTAQIAVVPGATAAPATATSNGSGTFTGAVVQDPYGQVQVQVTFAAGKITNVTALQLPSQGRSGFISQSVAPILQGEAISAQSATVRSRNSRCSQR